MLPFPTSFWSKVSSAHRIDVWKDPIIDALTSAIGSSLNERLLISASLTAVLSDVVFLDKQPRTVIKVFSDSLVSTVNGSTYEIVTFLRQLEAVVAENYIKTTELRAAIKPILDTLGVTLNGWIDEEEVLRAFLSASVSDNFVLEILSRLNEKSPVADNISTSISGNIFEATEIQGNVLASLNEIFSKNQVTRENNKSPINDSIATFISGDINVVGEPIYGFLNASVSEEWDRERTFLGPTITNAGWSRTFIADCPQLDERHCVGWSFTGTSSGFHVAIYRSTNGGPFFKVADNIPLTQLAPCSTSFAYGHELFLPFGSTKSVDNTQTDSYVYRVQAEHPDGTIGSHFDTPVGLSTHSTCIL